MVREYIEKRIEEIGRDGGDQTFTPEDVKQELMWVLTKLSEKVHLVVKASRGVVVEGHAFRELGKAEDKADDMRNGPDFSENDDDVDLIYDVPIE